MSAEQRDRHASLAHRLVAGAGRAGAGGLGALAGVAAPAGAGDEPGSRNCAGSFSGGLVTFSAPRGHRARLPSSLAGWTCTSIPHEVRGRLSRTCASWPPASSTYPSTIPSARKRAWPGVKPVMRTNRPTFGFTNAAWIVPELAVEHCEVGVPAYPLGARPGRPTHGRGRIVDVDTGDVIGQSGTTGCAVDGRLRHAIGSASTC